MNLLQSSHSKRPRNLLVFGMPIALLIALTVRLERGLVAGKHLADGIAGKRVVHAALSTDNDMHLVHILQLRCLLAAVVAWKLSSAISQHSGASSAFTANPVSA